MRARRADLCREEELVALELRERAAKKALVTAPLAAARVSLLPLSPQVESMCAVLAHYIAATDGGLHESATLRADTRARVAACDVRIRRGRGLLHAAGLLRDGTIPSQTRQHVQDVYAPKVAGVQHLHTASVAGGLRYCMLYSSIAALFGGGGQANYAAANACLDSFAHMQHAHQLRVVRLTGAGRQLDASGQRTVYVMRPIVKP